MILSERHSNPAPELIRLLPASQFTIEELTNAYNQTRVDYMVPMPMNAARLASYIKTYDVNMERSKVAVDQETGEMLGLAMLGVRAGRTWVTRLGVLPVRRRRGTGEALVRALLEGTQELGRPLSILEVIKGNQPAYQLFLKVGFHETRELVILRRPPGLARIDTGKLIDPARRSSVPAEPPGKVSWLEKDEALDRLCSHPVRPPWTNELESFINAEDAQGLEVDLGSVGQGWMIYRRQRFLLSHFVVKTISGDPSTIGAALISHLYNRFPHIDTYVENLPADDPHLPTLLHQGFMEVFRRVEMYWEA